MEQQQRLADYMEYVSVYRLKHRTDPSEYANGLIRWRQALVERAGDPRTPAPVRERVPAGV